MLRESRIEERVRRWAVSPIARQWIERGLGPAEASVTALLTAAAAALAFLIEPAIGGVLYLLSGALDMLDGEVARRTPWPTPRSGRLAGAFLDSMLDRYAEFLVMLGILGFYSASAYGRPTDGGSASAPFPVFPVLALFLAGFGSWMVSYAQARAEGLGSSCSFGWFERPERIVVLSAGAIVSPALDAALPLPALLGPRPALGAAVLVLAFGTNATALTRLCRGFARLRHEQQSSATDRVQAFLEASFPFCSVSSEWEPGSRAYVFRIREALKTLILEVPGHILDDPAYEPWRERLARWRIPAELRRHPRLLIGPGGPEPLPWRQLAPQADPIDEQVRESFPASDPAPRSSVS